MRISTRIGLALVMGVWVAILSIVVFTALVELGKWSGENAGWLEYGLGLFMGLVFARATFLATRQGAVE